MTAGPAALALEDLHLRFDQTQVIRGISLAVHAGERVGIIGPNGAGKSSLLNLISGRYAPSAGQVLLHGKRIDGQSPHAISRLGLSRSFQVTNLFPTLSVFENLRCSVLGSLSYRYSMWRFLTGLSAVNARSAEVMRLVQLEARADVPAANLSYAEQRALEIGLTVAGGAAVLLLDEPTAGMSRSETSHFTGLIRQVSVGKTLLMVEHDMGVMFDLADRIAVLVQGELLAFDTPDAVRANPRVQQAYLGGPC